jgi:hypothetical protein
MEQHIFKIAIDYIECHWKGITIHNATEGSLKQNLYFNLQNNFLNAEEGL